jgi:hypothetical protein
MHDGLAGCCDKQEMFWPLARVCNPGAFLTKTQSEFPAIKRHNSLQNGNAFRQSLGFLISQWILFSISKILCIFIAIYITRVTSRMGRWQSRRQGSRRETKIGVARKSEALLAGGKRWRRLLAVSSMQTNLGTKHRGFESSK